MKIDLNRFLPMAPATLHILLALAGDELHGYGIMLEAARQSDGKYKLGPGTLYDNLKKLLAAGIVEESRRQPAGCTGARGSPFNRANPGLHRCERPGKAAPDRVDLIAMLSPVV